MIDEKKINDNLINFWNTTMNLSEEDKEQIKNEPNLDVKDLTPSSKLYDAIKELGVYDSVLDYGCGSGWAALIASLNGDKNVDGVDIGENTIETAKFYNDLFKANVNFFSINTNWLNKVNKKYDAIVCVNVLDVVTLNVSKNIINNLARVLKPHSKAVIGLNFYMSPEAAKARNMDLVEDKYLFVDNILRLLSLSDEEWVNLFSPYFVVEKLDYFAWPNEAKETRRLFYLRRK